MRGVLYGKKIKLTDLGDPSFKSCRSYYGYSSTTQAAIIEVDSETGEVKVHAIIAAVDIGKAINRGAVIGQIEGALSMGLRVFQPSLPLLESHNYVLEERPGARYQYLYAIITIDTHHRHFLSQGRCFRQRLQP